MHNIHINNECLYRKYLQYKNSLIILFCTLIALNNKRNCDIIITIRASEKSVTLEQSPRHNIPKDVQRPLF